MDSHRKQYFNGHGFCPASVYFDFDRGEVQVCLLLKKFISCQNIKTSAHL